MVLGEFRDVTALAVSGAGLFAATPQGVAIYDTRTRRWLPPVTKLDGLPDVRAVVGLADPADESIWFGTNRGVLHYMPVLRIVEEIFVGGPVNLLVFDKSDPFRGIYLGGTGGWQFLPRGSPVPVPAPRLPPPSQQVVSMTVQDVLRRDPAADGMRSLALTDERMRRYRYSAAAEDARRRMVYFGTNGAGVIRYDPGIAEFDRMRFGLLADDAGAVLARSGAVWVGTGSRSAQTGFTRLDPDFQRFDHYEGRTVTGYPFQDVRDLEEWAGAVWAATDQGVFQVGDSRGPEITLGLPSRSTYALVSGPVGLWVGTANGLALIQGDADQASVNPGAVYASDPIHALTLAGETLWMGGPTGLVAASATPGAARPAVLADPRLREPVVALDAVGDTVVVAFGSELAWRSPGGSWIFEASVTRAVGELTALDGEPGGVWIGGSTGLGYLEFASRAYQSVATAADLPGPVVDVAARDGFVWVATERGLVRFERRALIR